MLGMKIIRTIRNIAKRTIKKIRPTIDQSLYISKVSNKAPWILVAYIPEVFYHKHDIAYLNGHQNKKEALRMVPIFNSLGYNVYVRHFDYSGELPDIDVRILFGHAPLVDRASKKWPNAYVVMYATGCLFTHQNAQEQYMTDLVNKNLGTNFPLERLVPPYNTHIIADKILLIGSNYTIETFPEEVRHKITLIHQSSQAKQLIFPIQYAKENEFFFMASSGNLLRGVPLLIDFFSSRLDKTLHIVGPIEHYLAYIEEDLPQNIVLHGHIDVNSETMASIMKRCNFIVYPTGSDGIPGAVINSMKNGLIPIVSKWGAFDEINEYGYLMKNWDVQSIAAGIQWADSLSKEQCLELKKKCSEFVKSQYNIENFAKEFEAFFREVTEDAFSYDKK